MSTVKNAGPGSSEAAARYPAASAQCEADYEHPAAPHPEPSVASVLSLDNLEPDDAIAAIRAIHESNPDLFADAAWALNGDNYAIAAEAHLQHLATWGAAWLWQAYSSDIKASSPAVAAVRVVRNRNLSPLTRAIDGIQFLIFPTGFVNMVDAFMRGYAVALSLSKASTASEDSTAHDSGLDSDLIGGASIWRLLKADFERARGWLSDVVNPMLLNEVLPAHLQMVEDDALQGFLAGGRGFLQGRLYPTGREDEIPPYQLTPQVASANYLVTVFALFHELAHVALDRALASTGTEKESTIDRIAFQLYYHYLSGSGPNWKPRLDFPRGNARLVFGAAGFYMIAICRQTVRLYFRALTRRDDQARKPANAVRGVQSSIVQLMVRRNELGLHIARSATGQSSEMATDLLNTLAESMVMEMAVKQLFRPADEVNIESMAPV